MEPQIQEWRPGVAVEDRELRTLVRRMNLAELEDRVADRAQGHAEARAFRRWKRRARYKRPVKEIGFSSSGLFGTAILYTGTGIPWEPIFINPNFFIRTDTAA